jgi:predicted DCC family thiol-disulfide oxidoreductase YuxK
MVPPLVFLYDGHCRLCVRGSLLMRHIARRGAVELRDFQEPGVLAAYPQLSHEHCMNAAQLIGPRGQIWSGCEAVVRALMTRPILGIIASIYYVPGLRFLADRLYALVAANRYRLMGRVDCDGACDIHLRRGP